MQGIVIVQYTSFSRPHIFTVDIERYDSIKKEFIETSTVTMLNDEGNEVSIKPFKILFGSVELSMQDKDYELH